MASYYVSASGSNSNSGTSASPWLTLQFACAAITAGDTLYIRGNASAASPATYKERVDISTGAGCDTGASNNPVTVTNYPGEFIQFIGGASTGSVDVFRITGLSWWNFSFQAPAASVYYATTDMQDTSSTGRAFYWLDGANDCKLENIQTSNGAYNPGLYVIRNSSRITIQDGKLFDNNGGAFVDASGIVFDTRGGDINDCVVQRMVIYDVYGDCVVAIDNPSGYKLNRPIVQDCALYTTVGGSSENPLDFKNCFGGIIRRNTMYGFRYCDGSTGGSGDAAEGSACIILHQNGGDLEFYDNVAYNTAGPLARINKSDATMKVYRNLFYNLQDKAGPQNPIVFAVMSGTMITNKNTIYGRHGTVGRLWYVAATGVFTSQNNVFHSTGNFTTEAGFVYTTIDHNSWYNTAFTVSGTGDITSDPQLVNPGGNDYRIVNGSPCKNAGTVVSPYTDGYLGSAPDIGYYEVAGAAATMILRMMGA